MKRRKKRIDLKKRVEVRSELKPCPFCGGKVIRVYKPEEDRKNDMVLAVIQCMNEDCGMMAMLTLEGMNYMREAARNGEIPGDDEDFLEFAKYLAVRQWNRRAEG